MRFVIWCLGYVCVSSWNRSPMVRLGHWVSREAYSEIVNKMYYHKNCVELDNDLQIREIKLAFSG